jgi:Zn-dependent protease/CBS domain-containing protein
LHLHPQAGRSLLAIGPKEDEMTETFRLGRIAGVRVGVNWSVVVIFALISLGLAAGRFPTIYPDLPSAAYSTAGLVAGLVFFASLLAHELAHAVVARRHGVEVEAITLWLFGGVAKLKGEPATPAGDLQVAAVGPLVSLVLAAAFAALTLVLDAAGAPGLVAGVTGWLALINVVLAVFNLVPAAPLDGGRILRAVWWWRTGDRTRAAVGAAQAGRVFGWVLIAGGVALALLGGGIGGLWMALIGWFITNAARSEQHYAEVSHTLAGLQVRDVMSPDPTVVPAGLDVGSFIDHYVFAHRYSTFPVVDTAGAPVGLVTLGRVKSVAADRRAVTTVGQVAVPLASVTVVAPDAVLVEVLSTLTAGAEGRALVVEQGRVVGIVSPADVMRRIEVADLAGPPPAGG